MVMKRIGAEEELENAGYTAEAFIDELIFQIDNAGTNWEYHEEAYRKYLEDWTLEELMSEAENHEMETEEFKEAEE